MEDDRVELGGEAKAELVEKKVTCPFLGSAVAMDLLAIRNGADNPLARIEDVRALGDSGGGSLGAVLALFATGNDAKMRGSTGHLDAKAPPGLFSLELPGSQGSHPGHSGILLADPKVLGSGRLSHRDLQRLTDRGKNGLLKRSEVGKFIAENVKKDPGAKVFTSVAGGLGLARDLAHFVKEAGPALVAKVHGNEMSSEAHRELVTTLIKMAGDDTCSAQPGNSDIAVRVSRRKSGHKYARWRAGALGMSWLPRSSGVGSLKISSMT